MGVIIAWIARGLAFGGPAAIGYFLNDVSSWIANVTGTTDKVANKERTGFAWWFIAIVAIVLGVVLAIILGLFKGRGRGAKIILLVAVAHILDNYVFVDFLAGLEINKAELLGSIAAATTDVIRSNFCPEYLVFNRATVPTSFIVEVAGDGVIMQVDGTGLTNLNGVRLVGELPANQYVFQVSNGYIKKNTSITIANPAGAVLDLYGFSDSQGDSYALHLTGQAFANQSFPMDDFYYFAAPSAAATDRFTVTFMDGTTQVMLRNELEVYLGYSQEVIATRYSLDNFAQTIKYVQFIGAANQAIYYIRGNATKGVVRQS